MKRALFLLLVGCGHDQEAERVVGLIDRMRDAPLEERKPHIDALASAQPAHSGAARARSACLEAYQALQAAHDRIDAARRRLDAGTPSREDVAAVDEALTDMARAKEREPACAAAVADLRRELRR